MALTPEDRTKYVAILAEQELDDLKRLKEGATDWQKVDEPVRSLVEALIEQLESPDEPEFDRLYWGDIACLNDEGLLYLMALMGKV